MLNDTRTRIWSTLARLTLYELRRRADHVQQPRPRASTRHLLWSGPGLSLFVTANHTRLTRGGRKVRSSSALHKREHVTLLSRYANNNVGGSWTRYLAGAPYSGPIWVGQQLARAGAALPFVFWLPSLHRVPHLGRLLADTVALGSLQARVFECGFCNVLTRDGRGHPSRWLCQLRESLWVCDCCICSRIIVYGSRTLHRVVAH
jgi:hypothetical protein